LIKEGKKHTHDMLKMTKLKKKKKRLPHNNYPSTSSNTAMFPTLLLPRVSSSTIAEEGTRRRRTLRDGPFQFSHKTGTTPRNDDDSTAVATFFPMP
jgi:hypothetical protein